MHRFLNIPTAIWVAQFSYVVITLGILAFIVTKSSTGSQLRTPLFAILYVLGMIVVNIIWRIIAGRYIH